VAPIPLRQWCILPLFQISPIFSKTSSYTPRKISPVWPFHKKIPIFIRKNFLRPYSHSPQIWNFPTPISLFEFISPLFREIFLPLYFCKFPSDFVKFTCFLHTLREFRFPLLLPWCIYASHNARTGRPLQCLTQGQAPKCKLWHRWGLLRSLLDF